VELHCTGHIRWGNVLVWVLLFAMVICNVYHGSTIDIIMYVKVYGKGLSVAHNNMRREGRQDN